MKNGKSKHTPGQWEVNYGNKDNNRFVENFTSQKFVHSIHSDQKNGEATIGFAIGRSSEEAEANADLLAASSDLLEAAIDALDQLNRIPSSRVVKLFNAIRKAQGECMNLTRVD